MPGAGDSFDSIYRAIVADASRGSVVAPRLRFEPADVAELCCRRLPLSALLSIDDDADFVAGGFTKILDRLASASDIALVVAALHDGRETRQSVIDGLLASEEYRRRGIRVDLI